MEKKKEEKEKRELDATASAEPERRKKQTGLLAVYLCNGPKTGKGRKERSEQKKQRHFQLNERKEKTVLIRRFKYRFVSSRIKTGSEESPPFPFHANCKSWQFISSDNVRQCGIISSPLSFCISH